jgi:hypothetical protein
MCRGDEPTPPSVGNGSPKGLILPRGARHGKRRLDRHNRCHRCHSALAQRVPNVVRKACTESPPAFVELGDARESQVARPNWRSR